MSDRRDPMALYAELLDELDQERPVDPGVKRRLLDEFEDALYRWEDDRIVELEERK